MKTQNFFYYHAGHLAIDKERPWQLCTMIGCVLGKFKTSEEAEVAIQALQKDKDAGILPCNLSQWDKEYLLRGNHEAAKEDTTNG